MGPGGPPLISTFLLISDEPQERHLRGSLDPQVRGQHKELRPDTWTGGGWPEEMLGAHGTWGELWKQRRRWGEGTPLLWRAGCGCLGACMFSEHPTPRSVDVVGGLCVFYKN